MKKDAVQLTIVSAVACTLVVYAMHIAVNQPWVNEHEYVTLLRVLHAACAGTAIVSTISLWLLMWWGISLKKDLKRIVGALKHGRLLALLLIVFSIVFGLLKCSSEKENFEKPAPIADSNDDPMLIDTAYVVDHMLARNVVVKHKALLELWKGNKGYYTLIHANSMNFPQDGQTEDAGAYNADIWNIMGERTKNWAVLRNMNKKTRKWYEEYHRK